MVTLSALTAANARRWAVARMLADRGAAFRAVARRLVAARDRYQAVAAKTGVPWFVIAVIHEREASQRWDASIAQGDPWDRVSTHVPKGRGPFASWAAAAIDALTACPPFAARWKDWSPGGLLTLLEQYNGLGYAGMGRPSPYVWSGTDQYSRGKYVRDGVYDPNVMDAQLGCAGLLLAMAEIDADVAAGLGRAAAQPPVAPAAPASSAKPSITHPAPGSLGAWLLSLFRRWTT
ncbi:MAG: hypothetical protein AB1586_33040 [Pseudomonadota bacterium]|jgi:lysozyme family protein